MLCRLAMGVIAALTAITLLGCQEQDIQDTSPTRISAKFEGTMDPAYVGDWKSTDGSSELVLNKDGSVVIVAVEIGRGGRSESKFTGTWLYSNPDLLIKYASQGSDIVLKNKATLEGSQLTLVQAGNLHKTVYKKG